MERHVKRIGILTSGGDAPGMNAVIRSVVRTAASKGIETVGIRRGYNGLITGDIIRLDSDSVSRIINKGGTMLYTARSEEFMTEIGQNKAAATCKQFGIKTELLPSAATELSADFMPFPNTAFPLLVFRQPLITISAAPITALDMIPRQTPPLKQSTAFVTQCSPTTVAPLLRLWATERVILLFMSVLQLPQLLFLFRKRNLILKTILLKISEKQDLTVKPIL